MEESAREAFQQILKMAFFFTMLAVFFILFINRLKTKTNAKKKR